MGSLIKNYFSRLRSLPPEQIFHATVMPCIDKRTEATRDQFRDTDHSITDVDFVLTTQDLFNLIKEKDIDFAALPVSPFPTLFTNSLQNSVRFFSYPLVFLSLSPSPSTSSYYCPSPASLNLSSYSRHRQQAEDLWNLFFQKR
jgi:hypothetical protein